MLFYEELVSATDSLILGKGYPENWNSSNVEVLGLASSPNRLDENKIESFLNLGYEEIKQKLGIGNKDFYLEIKNENGKIIKKGGFIREPIAYFAKDNGELELRDKLNDSSLIWDFYWGNRNNPPSGGYGNSRYQYNCSDYTGPGSCNRVKVFEMLIDNSSSYNTIITEDSEISKADLETSEFNQFESWIKNSGIYLHKTRGELFGEFNVSYLSDGFDEGIVESKDGILKNVEIGDNVTFSVSPYAVYSTQTEINNLIAWKGDESKTLFGYWNYGNGKVFYLADLTGDADGYELMKVVEPVPTIYKKGEKDYNASKNIYTVNREALLNGEKVKLSFVVWD